MPTASMTVSADSRPVLPNTGTSRVEYATGSTTDGGFGSPQRLFKKHKVLPHPRKDGQPGPGLHDVQRSTPRKYDLEIDTMLSRSSGSQASSPSRRHPARKQGTGPEPPPTPPAHSRTSSTSTSQPVIPSGVLYASSPLHSTEKIQARAPVTPTDQQTPPTPNLTPDRTPPGPAGRPSRPRPIISDRNPSKITADSRTESFRTAPENPISSDDDDDARSTLRPAIPSTKTSQSTVRQANGDGKLKPQAVGLGLGLESSPEDNVTPRTAKEFNAFDGEWGSGSKDSSREAEEEWDNNRRRNVVVRKRRPAVPSTPTIQAQSRQDEVVEDVTVTPTNATKALRSMSLHESPVVYPSRRVVSDKVPEQTAPTNSQSSINTDLRRSSMMSTKSTASTIVEAILVETAPQRRKTLRHVRKHNMLRDSLSDLSPASSAPTSVSMAFDDSHRPRLSNSKLGDIPRESQASATTFNSISSRKARREIWKNGGIPVVIVPDRRSSVKSSSKEPSLRSTSSRRSKRSQSLSSAPPSQNSKSKEYVPHFERPARRSRALSESDGSRSGDQRTIDYPPVIPARSSSLSAPTSRNVSRTGSLTTESLKAHNAFQAQQAHMALQKAQQAIDMAQKEIEKAYGGDTSQARQRGQDDIPRPVPVPVPQVNSRPPDTGLRRAFSFESTKSKEAINPRAAPDPPATPEDHRHRLSVDRFGDPFFGRRLSVHNTPFSQASVETTGTSHAEVSEAMAVNIYPHQNKSVLVVDHSNRPSENSSLEQKRSSVVETPAIRTTDFDAECPVTPPQGFSMDDVDSPLRNPRAPPAPPAPVAPSEPPAIKFIPATPSGLTPTAEKQKMLGNYFEMEDDEKPKRRMSLIRRISSRRQNPSEYGPSASRTPGLLTRTFSLSRNVRRDSDDEMGGKAKRPPLRRHTSDDRPADENRLHPHWRPTYSDYSDEEDDEDWVYDAPEDRTYKYPPIDNRPTPRRSLSLSQRMKKTFAILPVRDEYYDDYSPTTTDGGRKVVDRRTIRRTPSGNLRVMKHRRSMEDALAPQDQSNDGRPYTAPNQGKGLSRSASGRRLLRLWRSPSGRTTKKVYLSESVSKKNDGSGFLPSLGNKMNIPRRLSERRREKRSQELRRIISGPREVRDGVGDVIRPSNYR
ncbi:hypothetical protein QBC46DRAFT_424739 [Diplogelasinospora grovesii]|uniref:Uncharacterized protein n=1 Tax=Diplogelasinospora grovesii TaxID=303347 RepID=A0AAN6NKW6_9PEZI|nr:hypothetical protein QBC46DRAFT_424739 [Diplogelasinospora grovesii]